MHKHQVPYLSFQQVLLPGHCVCNHQRSLTSSGAVACTALTAGKALKQDFRCMSVFLSLLLMQPPHRFMVLLSPHTVRS
jgi:hypothetical protein